MRKGKQLSVRKQFSLFFDSFMYSFQTYWPWSKMEIKNRWGPCLHEVYNPKKSDTDWWTCNYMKQREHHSTRAGIRWVPHILRYQEKLPAERCWVEIWKMSPSLEENSKGSPQDRENNVPFGDKIMVHMKSEYDPKPENKVKYGMRWSGGLVPLIQESWKINRFGQDGSRIWSWTC